MITLKRVLREKKFCFVKVSKKELIFFNKRRRTFWQIYNNDICGRITGYEMIVAMPMNNKKVVNFVSKCLNIDLNNADILSKCKREIWNIENM